VLRPANPKYSPSRLPPQIISTTQYHAASVDANSLLPNPYERNSSDMLHTSPQNQASASQIQKGVQQTMHDRYLQEKEDAEYARRLAEEDEAERRREIRDEELAHTMAHETC